MKSIMKLTMGVMLLSAFIFSCKKEENKVLFEGGTAPVLSASTTADMVLLRSNAANLAVAFNWTNPDYKFNTGVSSQDVTYTLQVDTTGSNFTNPSLGEKVIGTDLGVRLSVSDLNNLILNMNLAENIPHNLELRIKSALVNSTVPLYSNVTKMVVTPYLDVVYPVPDNLYITGSATPLNWQCACATDGDGASQKFTKVNSSKFELTIALSGGNSYLLLPVWSSWAHKYGGMGANNSNNVNGDGFKPEGGDLKSPASSGTYKIVVEFKTGKFTVTPQ